MDNPLSPVETDVTLEDLFWKCLRGLQFRKKVLFLFLGSATAYIKSWLPECIASSLLGIMISSSEFSHPFLGFPTGLEPSVFPFLLLAIGESFIYCVASPLQLSKFHHFRDFHVVIYLGAIVESVERQPFNLVALGWNYSCNRGLCSSCLCLTALSLSLTQR